eukprot:340689-Pleurochrysis_carterae.AAC.1
MIRPVLRVRSQLILGHCLRRALPLHASAATHPAATSSNAVSNAGADAGQSSRNAASNALLEWTRLPLEHAKQARTA